MAKSKIKEQEVPKKTFTPTDEERSSQEFFEERLSTLKESRKTSGIENIWKAADKAYVPVFNNLNNKKKTLVSDDEDGWRSSKVDLTGDSNWQETSVPPNPYIKIQTALSILVDRNPGAVLTGLTKKYNERAEFIKSLYERSWEVAKSKSALLKPMVLNMAQYGIGVGRTYPLKIVLDVS